MAEAINWQRVRAQGLGGVRPRFWEHIDPHNLPDALNRIPDAAAKFTEVASHVYRNPLVTRVRGIQAADVKDFAVAAGTSWWENMQIWKIRNRSWAWRGGLAFGAAESAFVMMWAGPLAFFPGAGWARGAFNFGLVQSGCLLSTKFGNHALAQGFREFGQGAAAGGSWGTPTFGLGGALLGQLSIGMPQIGSAGETAVRAVGSAAKKGTETTPDTSDAVTGTPVKPSMPDSSPGSKQGFPETTAPKPEAPGSGTTPGSAAPAGEASPAVTDAEKAAKLIDQIMQSPQIEGLGGGAASGAGAYLGVRDDILARFLEQNPVVRDDLTPELLAKLKKAGLEAVEKLSHDGFHAAAESAVYQSGNPLNEIDNIAYQGRQYLDAAMNAQVNPETGLNDAQTEIFDAIQEEYGKQVVLINTAASVGAHLEIINSAADEVVNNALEQHPELARYITEAGREKVIEETRHFAERLNNVGFSGSMEIATSDPAHLQIYLDQDAQRLHEVMNSIDFKNTLVNHARGVLTSEIEATHKAALVGKYLGGEVGRITDELISRPEVAGHLSRSTVEEIVRQTIQPRMEQAADYIVDFEVNENHTLANLSAIDHLPDSDFQSGYLTGSTVIGDEPYNDTVTAAQEAVIAKAQQAMEAIANLHQLNENLYIDGRPDTSLVQELTAHYKDGFYSLIERSADYPLHYTPEDALILGTHLAVNYDILKDMIDEMIKAGEIPPDHYFPNPEEIVQLIKSAHSGDVVAYRKLEEALHWIPQESQLKILKKAGIELIAQKMGLVGVDAQVVGSSIPSKVINIADRLNRPENVIDFSSRAVKIGLRNAA